MAHWMLRDDGVSRAEPRCWLEWGGLGSDWQRAHRGGLNASPLVWDRSCRAGPSCSRLQVGAGSDRYCADWPRLLPADAARRGRLGNRTGAGAQRVPPRRLRGATARLRHRDGLAGASHRIAAALAACLYGLPAGRVSRSWRRLRRRCLGGRPPRRHELCAQRGPGGRSGAALVGAGLAACWRVPAVAATIPLGCSAVTLRSCVGRGRQRPAHRRGLPGGRAGGAAAAGPLAGRAAGRVADRPAAAQQLLPLALPLPLLPPLLLRLLALLVLLILGHQLQQLRLHNTPMLVKTLSLITNTLCRGHDKIYNFCMQMRSMQTEKQACQ